MGKTKQVKIKMLFKRSFLFILLFIVVGGVNVYAGENNLSQVIDLSVKGIDPTYGNGEFPRTPVQVPYITLDGHTLYTGNIWFDAILEIVDGDGEVVYTTFVFQGTPTITLPNDLTGDYELRLSWGNWCFYGGITL